MFTSKPLSGAMVRTLGKSWTTDLKINGLRSLVNDLFFSESKLDDVLSVLTKKLSFLKKILGLRSKCLTLWVTHIAGLVK